MHYSIYGEGDKRLLVVPKDKLMRYQFTAKEEIKFKMAGGKALAITKGKIKVYKKPHASAFHKEVMRQNGLALYRGLAGCDTEQIRDNMLEYVETI